jgi:excisionase family DNA binding protein
MSRSSKRASFKRALKEGRPVRVEPLAEEADVHHNTIYSLISRGEIEAIRIGRAIRVPARTAKRLLGMRM